MFEAESYREFLPGIVSQAKRRFIKVIPKRFRLPIRYSYACVTGAMEEELLSLEDLVARRQTAIDVGASIGLWSYKLAKLFRKVEAFEPILECAAEIKAYNAQNITVHDVALSSRDGFNEIHIPIAKGELQYGIGTFGNVAEHHKTIPVPLRTLDSYNFTNVAFIKIDVEGHELDVIKGAEITIAREKPSMVIEIEQRHLNFTMDMVFEKILGFGYEAFFLYLGKCHPYSEFLYKIHQEPFLSNPMSKYYVRNFLFKPQS